MNIIMYGNMCGSGQEGRNEGINIPCYMGRGSVVDQCRTHARLPFAPGAADSVKDCSLCSDNNIPGQVVGIVSCRKNGE